MKITQIAYPIPGAMTQRLGSSITDFIIHHTAGPLTQTPLEICNEHINRGFATIGYNWLIGSDGSVYSGRSIQAVPAAAYGRNLESVNVAVIGNFQFGDPGYSGPPTPQQIQSLKELCAYAHVTIPSIVRTIGHAQVAPLFYPNDQEEYSTLCPGNQLLALIPAIKAYVKEQIHDKL